MFTDTGLCGYIMNAMKHTTRRSTNLEEIFHNRSEHITMKCVESSATVHKKQSKHSQRIVVHETTQLERELNASRMTSINLEWWEYETQ